MTGTALPRVSIGIPVWNGEKYLAQTISSVRAQDWAELDIVLSDNGSTDTTEEICRQAAAEDGRIRYFRSDVNRSGTWNYNRLLELTSTEFFMWTAADDAIRPGYVRRCIEMFDDFGSEAVLVCPRTQLIDAGGTVFEDLNDTNLQADDPEVHLRVSKILRAQASHLMYGLIRRSTLDDTRRLLPMVGDDMVLLTELACRGKFLIVPEQLFLQRRHTEQGSAQGQNQVQWHAPDRRVRFAFPQTKLNATLCNSILHAPITKAERARCLDAVLRHWIIPRWRGMGSDLKSALGVSR